MPMLKDDELVGAIAIYRQEVRPFTDKQIELVTELRRSGGHRDREHAAAQRAAPAHRRSLRIAGAADRDLRGAQGHHQLARRTRAGVHTPCWRTQSALCEAKFGHSVAYEGDAFRLGRAAQCAAGVRRAERARADRSASRSAAGTRRSLATRQLSMSPISQRPGYLDRIPDGRRSKRLAHGVCSSSRC